MDIGKPENLLKRAGSTVYIRYLMPIIAKATILGKIKGNPWRMIGPTYQSLPTNNAILLQMKNKFESVEFKEFLMVCADCNNRSKILHLVVRRLEFNGELI